MLGLNLFGEKKFFAEKGIVSVNVYSDLKKTGDIKIKKITIEKKISDIIKRMPTKKYYLPKKSFAVSENVSNRTETPLVTERRSLFYIAEKNLNTFVSRERNFYPFVNSSLNGEDTGIEKTSEKQNGNPNSYAGGKEIVANLNRGFLNKDNNERLNEIRERIEQAKRYPFLAKERGIEGTSLVRFRLRENGKLDSIEMEQSSGRRILDRESMNTVKRAAPYPYVSGWIVVPLTYEIIREKQN